LSQTEISSHTKFCFESLNQFLNSCHIIIQLIYTEVSIQEVWHYIWAAT
jgi:hypothetical protein